MRVFGLGIAMTVSATTSWGDVPAVAVDIAPVHSIVSAVMGDLGTPSLIVSPGASPHGYSMRPSEARALDSADLVVWVGEDLTPWLVGPIETLAEGSVTLALLDAPETEHLDVREGATFAAHDHGDHDGHDEHDDHADSDAHDDHDDHDHAEHAHDDHEEHAHDDHAKDAHDDHAHEAHAEDHQHAHSGVDPHAWLDPRNAAAWADVIARTLSELDAANAAVYAANAQNFSTRMQALESELAAQLEPVAGRPFVVFHDAYHYFEHRFDIEAVGAVSSIDGDAPSPARVASLRDEIAGLNAVCALTEPQFNAGILDALGAAKLGEVDPIGVAHDLGPDHYPSVLRSMADALVDCLS